MLNAIMEMTMAKIPQKPEEIFQEIAADYQGVFGPDLISIILYGSGARGEYIPKKSDINFLVLLTENGTEHLSRAFKTVLKWHKSRVNTPLFLSKDYIKTSLDVFPIEFLNIKSHYQVIYGEDILQDVSPEKKFLRLQCERELKGKLLQLRHQFLETGGSKSEIEKLIARSVPTFYSIFRALLFLEDKAIPPRSPDLLSLISHKVGVDSTRFLDILKIKDGTKKLSAGEAVSFMEEYIEQIKKLTAFVDEMNV
jgi:predicted nucleotidyltransferase